MEINYELEAKDLITVNKHFAKKLNTHKPMVAIFSFVFITFLLADFIYAIFAGWADISSIRAFLINVAVRFLIWGILVGFILLVFYLIQLKALNTVAKNEKNGVLCQHKIVLSEKELIEITDLNTSRHAWASIAPITEIEDFIFITINSSSTYIIPKRHFQDREHINEFLETAKQYQQNAENTFQLSHLLEYERSLQ